MTWKVTDGVHQHIDVKEKQKENAFSLGKSLWINGEEYEDLDEIVARHVNPMAAHARDILNYKYYRDTQGAKRDIAEEILREEKRKAPSKIPYIISVVAKVSKFLFPKMFKLSTLSCFPGHAWKVHAFVPTATESSTRVRHRDARRVPLPEANVRDFERSHQVVQGAPQGSYSEHAWRAVCFKCC